MVKVEIQCPSCAKKGKIEVKENLVRESERGIVAINVSENLVCSHSFVAYIDKNLAVRDCFLTDFKIELPKMEIEQKIEKKEIPGAEDIDVYLISINLNALWLTFIIRSGFFKKRILIINEMDTLKPHLINFFNFIFQNSFEIDISLEKREVYKKDKTRYKNYIIIDGNKVINDKEKIMKPKKIKIERAIIQKFLAEQDPKSSLIFIRNEIKKAYDFSKTIIEFNKNLGEKKEFTSKEIMDYLKEVYGIKIQFQYLIFLIDIAKNYFKVELPMISRVSDFLGF
jgi:hypothetical protein